MKIMLTRNNSNDAGQNFAQIIYTKSTKQLIEVFDNEISRGIMSLFAKEHQTPEKINKQAYYNCFESPHRSPIDIAKFIVNVNKYIKEMLKQNVE